MTSPTPSSNQGLAELDARLDGRVLRPGSEDYTAQATPWNLAVVNDHLAAVEVANPQDVVSVLRCAAEQGLEVAVRATGHGAYTTSGRSLLVLTHRLDEVTVDPATRTARVGAAVTWAPTSRPAETAPPWRRGTTRPRSPGSARSSRPTTRTGVLVAGDPFRPG